MKNGHDDRSSTGGLEQATFGMRMENEDAYISRSQYPFNKQVG